MKSVEQMIQERAYEIYLNREKNGVHGDSDSDYYQAAKEITAEIEKKNAKKVKIVEEKKVVKQEAAPKKVEVKKAAPAAPAPKASAAPVKKKIVKKKGSR